MSKGRLHYTQVETERWNKGTQSQTNRNDTKTGNETRIIIVMKVQWDINQDLT